MLKGKNNLLLKFILLAVCFSSLAAEIGPFTYVQADDLVWDENSTEIQRQNLYGSQDQEGLYVYRARFPKGVMGRPHFHSMERHITVIEGTWYAGTDASYDINNATPIAPGGFMIHPAGAVHFDGSLDGPVVVEIKGIGPVTTTYVDIER